jgi:hypothetical protein
MARRSSSATPPARPATLSRSSAIQHLKARIEEATPLTSAASVTQIDFDNWDQTTRAVVVEAFGEPSANLDAFDGAGGTRSSRRSRR